MPYQSLHPDDASTGFMDGVDATIIDARYADFDYAGTRPAVNALKLTLRIDGVPQSREEYWPAGDKSRRSPDGFGLETKLNLQSKTGMMLRKAIESGLDGEVLRNGDVRNLVGLYARWDEIDTGRVYTPKEGPNAGEEFPIKFTAPTVIYQQPTGRSAAPSAPPAPPSAPSAPSAPTAPPAPDGSNDGKAVEIVEDNLRKVLDLAENHTTKPVVMGLAMANLERDDAMEVVELINTERWNDICLEEGFALTDEGSVLHRTTPR